MTDELTDAVRRLKQLQTDVERLKAARDQEGVPRLFFQTGERAVVVDAISLKETDLTAVDGAAVVDTLNFGAADLIARERAAATDAQGRLITSDTSAADTATAADAQADLRLQRTVERAAFNRSGYNTSTYS